VIRDSWNTRNSLVASDSLLSTVLGAAADRLRRDSLDRGKAG